MAPDPGGEPGAQADAQASGASAAQDGTAQDGTAKDGVSKASAAKASAAGNGVTQDSVSQDSAAQDRAAQADKGERRKRSFWRDLIVIVVAALALTVVLKAFVVQVFSIPSGSMENTLLPGDRILVSKIVYKFRPITRGDIVVFSGAGSWDPPDQPASNWLTGLWADATNLVGIAGPDTDYVKRVIGIPGDHVVCCNAQGQVTVNSVPLSESSYVYPGDDPSDMRFSITVPPGRLWVMGDNRGDSDDSRYRQNTPGAGTVPESAVVGRAFLIIWPLSRVSDLPIPDTFKQAGLRAAAAVATAPPATVAGGSVLAGTAALTWRRRRRRRPAAGRQRGRH